MAQEWGITRAEQDAFALESHRKAAEAYRDGYMDDLVTPFAGVYRDNNIRTDATLEKLATLKTAFDKTERGTLTAANSTPLTDGAAAVLLASEEWATKHGLPVQAYLTYSQASANDFVGGDGLLMAPTIAVSKMLERAGLRLQDFDYYEIHEAFAAQVLATLKAWEDPIYCKEVLGRSEPMGSIDRSKLNVRGSSIAMGHPFAATGARIVGNLAKLLSQHHGRGLISICTAGGMGVAAILESKDAAELHQRRRTVHYAPGGLTDTADIRGKVCDAPRTISNAGRALVMAKDKAVKAARQLEAARGLARELAGKLDLNASLRLWDGVADAARQERHRSIRDQHRRRRRHRLAAALADARQLHPPLRRQGHRLFRRHAHRPRLAAQSGRPFGQAEGARCAAVRSAAVPVPHRPQRRRRRRPGLRGRDHRPQAQDRRQQGLHPVPLRPVERVLRALSRSGDGLFLRLLHRLEQRRRPGAARQAGDDLPQAAPEAGRALPRHRLRLGRAHLPRGEELRRHARTASRCRRSSSPSPGRRSSASGSRTG